MPTSVASTRRPKPVPRAKRQRIDFSKGTVGKYYEAAMAARNFVLLDPDLLDTFPDSDAVNTALRSLKEVATRTKRDKAA